MSRSAMPATTRSRATRGRADGSKSEAESRSMECAHCGKAIVQSRGRGRPRKYCSADCRKAATYQDKCEKRSQAQTAAITETADRCLACGGEITRRRGPKARYCSPRCRGAAQHARDAGKAIYAPLEREIRILVCRNCGAGFSWKARNGAEPEFCSPSCRQKVRSKETIASRDCVRCGETFDVKRQNPRQRYCSPRCANLAKGPAYSAKYNTKRELTCKHCGKPFVPKVVDRVTYCSRECSFAAIASRPRPCKSCGQEFVPGKQGYSSDVYCSQECSDRGVPKRCELCGKEFYGAELAKLCSDDCRAEYNRRRRYEYEVAQKELIPRPCKECGVVFTPEYGNKRREFCSADCMHAYGHRVGHALRRARKHTEDRESVDPVKVFERDNWRCHICGKRAPKQLRGTLDDMAPELDHILPLAKGGSHTYANTACAHRKCNQKKGDQPLGQPRLNFGLPALTNKDGTIASIYTREYFQEMGRLGAARRYQRMQREGQAHR